MHKDETLVASHKGPSKRQRKQAPPPDDSTDDSLACYPYLSPSPLSSDTPNSDLSLSIQPSRDVALESLGYFFTNYVNTPRDPSTNIFIEHILPMYLNTSPTSALSDAIHAVAINITSMWMVNYVDTYHAREFYSKAVSRLKELLQDPVECKKDETLATVLMLDFYDSLNQRFVHFIDTGTHQQGAVALLKHRGEDNFKTPLSQRLFNAMRSRHINYSLQAGQEVSLDPLLLTDDTAILPSAKLDLINVKLSRLHKLAREGPEAVNLSLVEFYQLVLKQALVVEKELQAWTDGLPKSWQPLAVPASEVHPSIHEAGLYQDMCEVYSSLTVSHINNAARSSQIGTLRLVALSTKGLEEMGIPVNPELDEYLTTQVQYIADRFCASIPFHLGNRTGLAFPHEYREYPQIPAELRQMANYVDPFGNKVEMTMEDHVRAAAAIGGWFVMTPLAGFLKAPVMRSASIKAGPLMGRVRKGQLDWIRGQMLRLQKIYLFPAPTHIKPWQDWNWMLEQSRIKPGAHLFSVIPILAQRAWPV